MGAEVNWARQQESRHYHLDDYPLTLDVLAAVAQGRDLSAIGYEPTEFGAEVNWDRLAHSWLSTTEKATVAIAQGVALAEWEGNLPDRVVPAVNRAVAELTKRLAPESGGDRSTERPALPGELCTCGRQARTVFHTSRWGDVGSCDIEGSGQRPILPCPFCGATEAHTTESGSEVVECPQYQLQPAGEKA